MVLPSLQSFFVSIAFGGFLLSISLFVGFVQLLESQIRKTNRTNRKRRRQILERLGIEDTHEKELKRLLVGFFHPYCNAGGGGERVLFEAISHHQAHDADVICVVYTGDVGHLPELQPKGPASADEFAAAYKNAATAKQPTPVAPKPRSDAAERAAEAKLKTDKEEIIMKVKARFEITLDPSRLIFLPLENRKLVDDGYWTRFTLLGQSLGSVFLAFEAMGLVIPDVFIDSMGYAFTYPAVRLFQKKLPIGSYTHYPTISTDMLQRVKERRAGHTNASDTATSAWRSAMKLRYYQAFAWIYSWALRRADVVVANGTWTRNHLNQLMNAGWSKRRDVEMVYPPCDTKSLAGSALDDPRAGFISLAQFRPEKEHATQLRFLRALLDRHPDVVNQFGLKATKLTMMGSCRNEGDEARIEMLKTLVAQLALDDHVEFLVNAPWSEVCQRLASASVGISTMVDEHFGMNVVEFMAAGLITLSHASAGPLMDIAVADAKGGKTGYHALTPDEFADQAYEILSLPPQEQVAVRTRARRRAQETFGTDSFQSSWRRHLWEPLVAKFEGAGTPKRR